jgi:hypothetical protein
MIEEIAARVEGRPGQVVSVALAGPGVTRLIYELDIVLDTGTGYAVEPAVHLVLGRSCRTRAEAVAQFVAALRLPYAASLGWDEFIYELGEGSAASRRCVVVADAQELLAADPPAREELLTQLPSGPHCMGGGWSTLVLADSTTKEADSTTKEAEAGTNTAEAGTNAAEAGVHQTDQPGSIAQWPQRP